MRPEDFTVDTWQQVSKEQAEVQRMLQSFGGLRSVTLMERSTKDVPRSHRYRFEFEKARTLQCYIFDERGRVMQVVTEDIE